MMPGDGVGDTPPGTGGGHGAAEGEPGLGPAYCTWTRNVTNTFWSPSGQTAFTTMR